VIAEPKRRAVALITTAGACGLLAVATRAQMSHWHDSRALFLRALAVTGPNPVMHHELGLVLFRAGDPAVALSHFEQAVSLAPDWGLALQNLGSALTELGYPDRALPYLERGIALGPERPNAVATLGATLLRLQRNDEALEQFERAVRLEPSAKLLERLADAEMRAGRLDQAIADQRRAVAAAREAHGSELARLTARLEALERSQKARSEASSSSPAPPAAGPPLVAPARVDLRRQR
jgi:tetratricopeptide (TPR) repeat protein